MLEMVGTKPIFSFSQIRLANMQTLELLQEKITYGKNADKKSRL